MKHSNSLLKSLFKYQAQRVSIANSAFRFDNIFPFDLLSSVFESMTERLASICYSYRRNYRSLSVQRSGVITFCANKLIVNHGLGLKNNNKGQSVFNNSKIIILTQASTQVTQSLMGYMQDLVGFVLTTVSSNFSHLSNFSFQYTQWGLQ